jgi:hypothetical protein
MATTLWQTTRFDANQDFAVGGKKTQIVKICLFASVN